MQPHFKIKAVQLDLARQMETPEFIYQFIDFIAEKGFNTLFLYLEYRVRTAVFDIGADAGYTPEEISAIVRHAQKRSIEVIPGLACLGHAELLLGNAEYQHLCELRGDTVGRFWASPKMELCPSLPETREFIEAYFSEVAPLFPSRYLHVGGDEVFNIGYCEKCAPGAANYSGEQALYGEHIRFCHSVVTGKLGKRMMMWDDMIEYYPDAFSSFPRDIILVNWQYQKNAVQWEGHFNNRDFRDQLAYYEKENFEYLIAPADYHWSNIETLTASVRNKKCLGGLLTTWEKKDRLMLKYLPIIAGAGALWSDLGNSSSEKVLYDALAGIFTAADKLLLDAVAQYLEFYGKGAKIFPSTMTIHPFDGPDWEMMRSLRSAAGILKQYQSQFAGTFAGSILDDILADLLLQEAACRLHLASYKMLNGQTAEPLQDIAADVASAWELNIAACAGIRTAKDVEYFRKMQQDALKCIADFEHNISACGRVETVCCLPDYYEAEKLTVRIKSDGKYFEAASGVFKRKNAALYVVNCFIPAECAPSEIELAAEGYGGQGIAYISVKSNKGTFVPQSVLEVSGKVWHPEYILSPDVTFAYLGDQKTLDAFHDRSRAAMQNIVRIAMKQCV